MESLRSNVKYFPQRKNTRVCSWVQLGTRSFAHSEVSMRHSGNQYSNSAADSVRSRRGLEVHLFPSISTFPRLCNSSANPLHPLLRWKMWGSLMSLLPRVPTHKYPSTISQPARRQDNLALKKRKINDKDKNGWCQAHGRSWRKSDSPNFTVSSTMT